MSIPTPACIPAPRPDPVPRAASTAGASRPVDRTGGMEKTPRGCPAHAGSRQGPGTDSRAPGSSQDRPGPPVPRRRLLANGRGPRARIACRHTTSDDRTRNRRRPERDPPGTQRARTPVDQTPAPARAVAPTRTRKRKNARPPRTRSPDGSRRLRRRGRHRRRSPPTASQTGPQGYRPEQRNRTPADVQQLRRMGPTADARRTLRRHTLGKPDEPRKEHAQDVGQRARMARVDPSVGRTGLHPPGPGHGAPQSRGHEVTALANAQPMGNTNKPQGMTPDQGLTLPSPARELWLETRDIVKKGLEQIQQKQPEYALTGGTKQSWRPDGTTGRASTSTSWSPKTRHFTVATTARKPTSTSKSPPPAERQDTVGNSTSSRSRSRTAARSTFGQEARSLGTRQNESRSKSRKKRSCRTPR